jgi:SRSO17 transposase
MDLNDPEITERAASFLESLAPHLPDHRKRANFAQYFAGLLSGAERKSIEPLAAMGRTEPLEVRRAHHRLVHFVGDSEWSDHAVRLAAARYALSGMTKREPVRSWIIDDTGFLKQGRCSPGVQRMYTGSAGKIANCQIGVSLTLATASEHVPVDMDLYVSEAWASDEARRRAAKIPPEVVYRPKWKMALDMIERAKNDGLPTGVVLADSAYGDVGPFRHGLEALGLAYAVGLHASTHVQLVNAYGRLNQPQSLASLARSIRSNLRRRIEWREGTKQTLSSRMYVCEVRVPGEEATRTLVIEWRDASPDEPKFTLSTIPKKSMTAKRLVELLMSRWRTERVYEDLKGELGLDHYEGRKYTGWQHHVSVVLCCAAFVTAEKVRAFPPSASRAAPRSRNPLAA